jgi:hypothetical protein
MLNVIPFIGWFLNLVFTISLCLPFYICWTYFGIGTRYFYFLPDVYQSVGFWNCVGLFTCVGIIQGVFVPKIVNVTQTNSK